MLQRSAAAVMEPVNRALAATQVVRDLSWREADEMAEEHDVPLVVRQGRQCQANRLRAIEVHSADALAIDQVFRRSDAIAAQMVDRDVAREAQQPGEERHAAFVVLGDRRHQFGENVLGDVLGLVVVTHDRPDIAIDVVRVGDVQEAHGVRVALLGAGYGEPSPARRLR